MPPCMSSSTGPIRPGTSAPAGGPRTARSRGVGGSEEGPTPGHQAASWLDPAARSMNSEIACSTSVPTATTAGENYLLDIGDMQCCARQESGQATDDLAAN